MDKQYRKQLEQQLTVTIAYFLRQTDEATAVKMVKQIKSAAKDLAKKFVKTKSSSKEKEADQKKVVIAVKTDKNKPAGKSPAKDKKRRVPAKKKSPAKKAIVSKAGKTK